MSGKARVMLAVGVAVLALCGLYFARGTKIAPGPVPAPSSADAEAAAPGEGSPELAPLPLAAQDAGVAAPASAAPAFDLFEGQMDDLLAEAHLKVLDGERLSLPMLRQLVAYRKEHPDDPRANMLLAYDSMGHMRHGEAVRLYRMAYRNDPVIAKDPRVLTDLVFVVAEYSRQEFREACEVIELIYGDKAIGEVDRRIQKARQDREPAAVERLQTLRERLLSPKE